MSNPETQKEIVCVFDTAFYITHRKRCLWDLIEELCEKREELCDQYVDKARDVPDDATEIEKLIYEVGKALGVRVSVVPKTI